MGQIEYSTNNSGGSWWLTDEDWYALEEAGWTVQWEKDIKDKLFKDSSNPDRWLGALATKATFPGDDFEEAVRSFENATGQHANDQGCDCCGQPHSFTRIDDNGNWSWY